jgi:hypothetical protein
LSVFTRVADRAHLLGLREHDLADMRLKDLGDRKRVAGRLENHPIIRRDALREQLQLLRRRRDPSGRARSAAVSDRDLAEVAIHV